MDTTIRSEVELSTLIATRRSLHGIAECLLAGPEHRATGEIALRITPGGFATTAGPELRLDGADLVGADGRSPLVGSFGALAAAVGVEFGAPDLGYPDGSGVAADDLVVLDRDQARRLTDWFVIADTALRVFAPTETPILWPEHFDVAVLVTDHSFGASPGDEAHPRPYAYVSGPDNDGSEFFNVGFGARRDASEMRSVEDLVAFWREGLARLTR